MTDPEYFGVWGRYEGLEIFNRELVCSVRDIVERYTKKVEEKLIKTNKKDITSIAALTRNKTYLDEMQRIDKHIILLMLNMKLKGRDTPILQI